ncbi:myoglobin-like [Plectropomus leopardus]|uniref:myoglobin-like n=1 Tax=Plectropomus leopardus TaxID=160734 RepID=UPI001C4B637A|nr:myoglobin-like [Plectropomus leopardus]XP_042341244.1 myoglobin-like [Plectropomus leopardus]
MDDYDIVLKYWATVEADYATHGNLLLTRLFKQHPHTLKLFPKFADIAQADLTSDADVTALGAAALKKMAELFRAKGKHDAILKPLIQAHAKQHKVPAESFLLLTEIVGKILVEKANLDAAGQQAMENIMGVLRADMRANFKELDQSG